LQIIETIKIPLQNEERALLLLSILRISDSDFPNEGHLMKEKKPAWPFTAYPLCSKTFNQEMPLNIIISFYNKGSLLALEHIKTP